MKSSFRERSNHDLVRHAATEREARLSAHDDHAAAFALADDEFGADIQAHLGHSAIKPVTAFQRNDEYVTAFVGHTQRE